MNVLSDLSNILYINSEYRNTGYNIYINIQRFSAIWIDEHGLLSL